MGNRGSLYYFVATRLTWSDRCIRDRGHCHRSNRRCCSQCKDDDNERVDRSATRNRFVQHRRLFRQGSRRELMVGTEASGFQTTTATHVVTEVDQVSTVNITLKVGATTAQVSVAATAATLNTESATVGTLVTTKELTNLPLDGRSWISLNYLAPGAVNFHGTTAHESIMGSVTPPNVVLNGLRGGNNAYYIDGSSLQDRETQVIRVIPPLDSLSEFRVQTSNFDAQYANGAGGASPRLPKAVQIGFTAVSGSTFGTTTRCSQLFQHDTPAPPQESIRRRGRRPNHKK